MVQCVIYVFFINGGGVHLSDVDVAFRPVAFFYFVPFGTAAVAVQLMTQALIVVM